MPTDFDEKSRAEQQHGQPPENDGGAIFNVSPLDSESVAAFNQRAHEIKASADAGGWAISEEGMKEYKRVCDAFLDRFDEMFRKATDLTTRAKLGSSPYAYDVADFNVKVAIGDEHSLIPNLKLMKDGYKQLQKALDIARTNYNENEAAQTQRLGRLMPE